MEAQVGQFSRFAQYNTWFNGRLFDCVEKLEPGERTRDLGAFFHSIEATLDHVLLVDRIWLGRMAASELAFPSLETANLVNGFGSLRDRLHADFDSLRRGRCETDAVIEAWVRDFSPELLARSLRYRNSSGAAFEAPVWHVVAHLFNHQTHHRGQVTTLLSQLGQDVGITDFILTAFMPELDA